VLRLQMILKAAGLEAHSGKASKWPLLARALNEPRAVAPQPRPRPRPPVSTRPRQLSVTRIETLIRDPYAIYGREILKLQPVEPIAANADPARRGMVVHDAINDFLSVYPEELPPDAVSELLRFGRVHFDRVLGDPSAFSFWWPRFERIAQWLVDEEKKLRPGIVHIHAEIAGGIDLLVAGETFRLTCRADRVDVLKDGTARIIDYKTGGVPSADEVKVGLAPQLTLQAAILSRGGFTRIAAIPVSDVAYVKLSGGEPAGEHKGPKLGGGLAHCVDEHVAGLARLIAAYSNPAQRYLPRTVMKKEEDESPYDHLSRYREWALSGDAK
jgi:ATP-dependent helicase/nuclease subunit B